VVQALPDDGDVALDGLELCRAREARLARRRGLDRVRVERRLAGGAVGAEADLLVLVEAAEVDLVALDALRATKASESAELRWREEDESRRGRTWLQPGTTRSQRILRLVHSVHCWSG